MERFFDSMATRIHGERAAQSDARINFVFSDLGESHVLWIENGVLHHAQREPDPAADATVRLTHRFFLNLVIGQLGLREALFSDELDLDGSRTALFGFFRLLEGPTERFPIVTP